MDEGSHLRLVEFLRYPPTYPVPRRGCHQLVRSSLINFLILPMTQSEQSSEPTGASLRFFPERFHAVSIIGSVGIVLVGAILFDVYRDLVVEGNPVWIMLGENIFPLSVALGTAGLGWWWARSTKSVTYLREAARRMLLGVLAMAVVGGVVLGGQFLLSETHPFTILVQLLVVGAAVGFFHGRQVGRKREVVRELRHDRDLLRRIQEVAEIGGWEYDRSTDTVTGTDQLNQILGLAKGEQFTIERGLGFYLPERRSEIRDKVRRCLEEGRPFEVEAQLLRDEDDEQRWIRVRGQRRETGRLTGTLQDITEEKKIKQVLKDEQEVLRRMYRVTASREISFDEKINELIGLGREYLDLPYGHVTRLSEDTQEITHARGDHPRLSPGESCLLGKSYCRKTVQQDGLLVVQNAPEEGWADDPAYEAFGLDSYIGSKILVGGDIYGTFCFSSDRPRAMSFCEREKTFVELLTLWARYEITQRQKTRRLKDQNQRLDRFASVVSHDLRNPLTVAINRLELIERGLPSRVKTHDTSSGGDGAPGPSGSRGVHPTEDAEVAEHVEETEKALQRMKDLIDDMLVLMWGRREADAGDVEPVDFKTAAERSWPDLKTPEASLTVETDREILAHKGRLQQLLENLLRNAVEHGGADVSITIGALEPGDEKDGFFVEDDGPGIPEKKQKKVLESGYSTEEEGTGLGLSIARAVTDAHGWTLSITESHDGGARFEIRGADMWR